MYTVSLFFDKEEAKNYLKILIKKNEIVVFCKDKKVDEFLTRLTQKQFEFEKNGYILAQEVFNNLYGVGYTIERKNGLCGFRQFIDFELSKELDKIKSKY